MSLQHQITDLGAALARRLGASFAFLTKPLASLVRPARRPCAEPGVAVPPSIVVDGKSEANSAETSATEGTETACAELLGHAASPSVIEPVPPPGAAAPALAPQPIDVLPAVPPLEPLVPADAPDIPADQAQLTADSPPPADCPALLSDPELDRLRARLVALEARVVDLASRKAEMGQLLDEYAYCQYRAVGELLGEQLRLQHDLLQRRAERSSRPEATRAAAAAAEEYAAYQRARQEPAAPPIALGEDEGKELTALYRTVVMRCHPDRVGEAEKARAHELFLRTQDVYQRRDLAALRLISSQIAADERSVPADDGASPRERLDALLESLEDQGLELLLAIEAMQAQAQYRRARRREQWDDYFAALRDRLEDECAELQRQIARC